MKFKITSTSFYFFPEEVEFLENYDLKFEEKSNNNYTLIGPDTIEIGNLEELIDIQESLGELILLGNINGVQEIEIYNDYRE